MTNIYTQDDLSKMHSRFRAKFINSLSGYKSANLLGSTDHQKQTNLSIVSSCFHLGADPALMGLIIRPHDQKDHPRHSLQNILETKVFTINHVSNDILESSHQTSARFEKNQSEFTECRLTPEWIGGFESPFVKESKIKFGLELREHQLLLNKTNLIIGQIVQVIVPKTSICEDGHIDIEKTNSIAVSGLDSYHLGEKVTRLSYAKTTSWPSRFE